MNNKIKISVRVPDFLRKEMQRAIIKENYGLKGKSVWLSEAVNRFLSKENFADFVNIGDEFDAVTNAPVE